GAGPAEVFFDDLTVGPVTGDLPPLPAPSALPEPSDEGDPDGDRPEIARAPEGIRMDRNHLSKNGYPWFPTIIHAPGADPAQLRRHGFDVVAANIEDKKTANEAVKMGFLLMPRVGLSDEDGPKETAQVLEQIGRYPAKDSVAFWNLGEGLGLSPDFEERTKE